LGFQGRRRDHRRLVNFFSEIGDDVIESIMADAIVPLAIEALWTFSGFGWMEELFSTIYDILGLVDDIVSAFGSITGDVGDWFEGASDDIPDLLGFRHFEEFSTYSDCTGHYTSCNEDTVWKASMPTVAPASPAGCHSMYLSLPWTACASQLTVYVTL
jgi:hypothetical protein